MLTAYIDPGAGSMVIQAVLAGLLAIPFLFRGAISRAVDRIRGRGRFDSDAETPERDADA